MKSISTKHEQHQRTLKWLLLSIAWCAIAMVWSGSIAQAQSQYYSKVERDGFVLTKFVSDTEVPSGRTFEYHITFSIPAGATNISIIDNLPSTVEYVSSSYYVNQTCPPGSAITPTITLPVGSPYGGTYKMDIASAPCGAVGSFTIVVRFPCGVTCDSTRGVNSACMIYTPREGQRSEICTKGLLTIARAQSTWQISKRVTNAAYQGGNCPNAVNDSVIRYCISVFKSPGTEGQLNLFNGVVTDVIPAGAYVRAGSSCIPATAPGSVTPTTLTWNVGSLSGCAYYNNVECCFEVVYPRALFPVGSQVTNTAVLSGQLGERGACGKLSDPRSSVCSEFKAITRGNISKWAQTNGQPGCAGSYYIRVCNNGNTPLSGIVVRDTLPGNLTYGSPIGSLPSGWSISFTPGGGPRIFSMTSGSASLPVGSCVTIEIPFTINTSAPPGIIQNCVTLYAAGTTATTTCYSFAVTTPQPIACVAKMVCNKKPWYSPGDTLTYRLRIQNIGGMNLAGATITDALDPNLVYLGNVRGYVSSNYNIACGQPNTWGPITALFPSGGPNTVQFNIPTIPFNCNALGSCGQNGTTVPFYFIEFDVKVSDSSALGSIYNFFRMNGGTLPGTVTSNVEGIVVSANTSYWLEKGVRSSPDEAFSTSATAVAGSNIEYQLKLNIPTATPRLAALRNVSFIDLLPKDNAPAFPNNDQYILTCYPRGSAFNVTYQGPYTSLSNPYPNGIHENTYIQYPNIRTWWPTGAPQYLFNGGCATGASTWNGAIVPGDKNFGFYFGPWAFTNLSPQPAWVSYVAKIADDAQVDQTACNTFVASASVRYIVNGSTLLDIPIAEAESQDACVTIIPDDGNCLCDSAYFEPFTIPGLEVDYRTVHVVNRHNNPISWIDIEYYDCATGTLITDPSRPVVGGGVRETRTGAPMLTLPVTSFVPPYRRVPASGVFPSWSGSNMQDEVMFNIGFNFFGTVPPTWCIRLIIHHEGGDTCTWDLPPWTPQPPSDEPGTTLVPKSDRDRIYLLQVTPNLDVYPAEAIGFITFTTTNDEDIIVGGSGGPLYSSDNLDQSSIVKSFVQSNNQALFRIDVTSQEMTPVKVFILTRDPERRPELVVSLFDRNAGILSQQTMRAGETIDNITTVNEATPGDHGIMINSIIPNPSSGSFTCKYTLGTGEVARLELFTMLGQSVAVLSDQFQSAGQHQLNYKAEGLAEGTYYLRLTTSSGTVSTVVNIAR